ncbi:hypothetical protein GCM10011317_32230 [Niveispirillum cyanobacteriorum]|nr:hypothetical protein GCM10011317_32230 [Niveispirillum cyanobacteriorum]
MACAVGLGVGALAARLGAGSERTLAQPDRISAVAIPTAIPIHNRSVPPRDMSGSLFTSDGTAGWHPPDDGH